MGITRSYEWMECPSRGTEMSRPNPRGKASRAADQPSKPVLSGIDETFLWTLGVLGENLGRSYTKLSTGSG